MTRYLKNRVAAVDLFCGAGGLTRGLLDAGVKVVAGYDIDTSCRFAYEENNEGARFHNESVSRLCVDELAHQYPRDCVRVLVGCAPCQTFSKYTQGLSQANDPKWTLLTQFARLIRGLRPDIVSMENVPELADYRIFSDFLSVLREVGFYFTQDPEKWVAYCPDYGIPQNRRRLVILASRLGPIDLIPPTHRPEEYVRVKDAIGKLPRLHAGQVSKSDPLHRSSSLSERNLKRIRASQPGGTWRDWPIALRADCHKGRTGKSYPSVYGRMEWNKPSPTITTQFYGYGSGRFGHPEQDRGLSLREGAILQSFPIGYRFVEPGTEYSFKGVGRLIGNAVPVRLGAAIGTSIMKHVSEHEK